MKNWHNTLFFMMGVLPISACGNDSPDEAVFKEGMQNYIAENVDEFLVELPLNNANLTAGNLRVGLLEGALDFASLQVMANKGRIERVDEVGVTVLYKIPEDERQFFRYYSDGLTSVMLGQTDVNEVVRFTEAVVDDGVKKSYATVTFKNNYNDWLEEEDILALRNWTMFAADVTREPGISPAKRSYQTVFNEIALASMLASLSGSRIFDLPQYSVYWVSLALESYTMRVPFISHNDGWAPISDLTQWELVEVNGVGGLTDVDMEDNMDFMVERIFDPIDEAPAPEQNTLFSLVDEKFTGPILYQTPLGESGVKKCLEKSVTGNQGEKVDSEYECSPEEVEQLDLMTSNDHVARSVPTQGKVEYSIKEKYLDHLSGEGLLMLGDYKVVDIALGEVQRNMIGMSLYDFSIEVFYTPFEWALPYIDDRYESSSKINLSLVYADGAWVPVNF